MTTTISTQDIVNAKRDIDDIGKAVNEKVIVSPRYGEDFKSLPMIAKEFQDAINTIVIDGGVPALAVFDANGVTQQDINDFGGAKWRNKAGGYALGATVKLDNGDIVKSTINKNTNNPNVDMTGWVYSSLTPSNNLGDVADKVTARTNLGVYSKTETASIATTPSATETVAGKAKIATTAIAREGENDTDFITAKKLRAALNATGGAPISACRSWVSFNGNTNPPTILNSSNVSSITQNSTGDWTINFTTAMPHSDYAPVLGFNDTQSGSGVFKIKSSSTAMGHPQLKTTTQLRVCFGSSSGGAFGSFFSVGVFC